MPRAGDARSLPHASVGQLVVAPDGTLWVGTKGGVARWTGRDFERVPGRCAELARTSTASPSDPMARLWIGTPTGSACAGPTAAIRGRRWADRGLQDKILHVLQRDRSGQYWFDIAAGLGRDSEDKVVNRAVVQRGPRSGLVQAVVGGRARGPRRRPVVRQQQQRPVVPAGKLAPVLGAVASRSMTPESIANAHVRGIAASASGDMWLVGTGGVLDRLDPETGAVKHVYRRRGRRVCADGTCSRTGAGAGVGELPRWRGAHRSGQWSVVTLEHDRCGRRRAVGRNFASHRPRDGTIWVATATRRRAGARRRGARRGCRSVPVAVACRPT